MRVGLLGYGVIAEEHAHALSSSGCTLAIVGGPKRAAAARFAEKHGVERSTDDLSEVIAAEGVDAVVVASPNAVHAGQTLACLAAGKDVLCEVPLAMSAEDARSVASASASGRSVMVCQTQRFLEPVQRLREWSAATTIRHIVIRLVLPRTDKVGVTGRPRTWIDHVVWHHGSHAVDTALWLLGDKVTDVATLGAGRSDNGSSMDVGIVLRTDSGALVTLALSYRAHAAATDFLVVCDAATYRYEHGVLSSSDGAVHEYDQAQEFRNAVRRQDEHFVSHRGGSVSPTPAELLDVYQTLGLISNEIERTRDA